MHYQKATKIENEFGGISFPYCNRNQVRKSTNYCSQAPIDLIFLGIQSKIHATTSLITINFDHQSAEWSLPLGLPKNNQRFKAFLHEGKIDTFPDV